MAAAWTDRSIQIRVLVGHVWATSLRRNDFKVGARESWASAILIAIIVAIGGGLFATPVRAVPITTYVAIQGFSFVPGTVVVVIGVNNTVTWVNKDPVIHTATAVNGTFNSRTMPAGGNFTFTFETAGAYDYYCVLHPFMTGTVIVMAQAAVTTNGTTSSGSNTVTSSARITLSTRTGGVNSSTPSSSTSGFSSVSTAAGGTSALALSNSTSVGYGSDAGTITVLVVAAVAAGILAVVAVRLRLRKRT